MNIHHLELFYYVAKHGGVSEAARRIPYGIQQPAISAQIIQLEDSLGVTLFQRRPFRLSKPGEELLQFIEPFFAGIPEMEKRLRGDGEVVIRIGTVETIQRHYLPKVLKGVRARFPKVSFSLNAAGTDEVESKLLSQEIDIGIAPLLGRRPPGVKQKELVRVPMALMIPENKKLNSAETLWKMDRIGEPLIVVGAGRAVTRLFLSTLQIKGVEWFPSLELNTQDLAPRYVTEGFGIGLVLVEPGVTEAEGTRLLPLPGFPEIPYGLIWMGEMTPLQQAFLEEAEKLTAGFSERKAG